MQATKHKAQAIPQMTMALCRASEGLSVFVLALVFSLSDLWAGTAAVLGIGALWLLGHLRALPWTSSVAMVLQTAAAVLAVLIAVGGAWPVLGLVAALVAWDLDQFAQRMRAAGRVDGAPELERRHIQRLLVVAAIGGSLGAIGLGLQMRLSFGLALVLAVLVILCLGLMVGYMRRAGD